MTITLFKTEQGWMARHSGKGSESITTLFGTNILPTPFTAQAKAHVVLAEIERLNPAADVWLDWESDSQRGSTLTPALAILTIFVTAAVLVAQSGLLHAVLVRLAEVR